MTESTYRIEGATGGLDVVISLEVHARVARQFERFYGAAPDRWW